LLNIVLRFKTPLIVKGILIYICPNTINSFYENEKPSVQPGNASAGVNAGSKLWQTGEIQIQGFTG
jgi:hypothetical protein